MLTRRRAVIAIAVLAVALAVYTVWQMRQVQAELERAEASVSALRAAIEADDVEARDQAIADLQDAAAAAHDGSDGPWWGVLTHAPFVGDDVEGVRVLSAAIDTIAAEGISPLVDSVRDLDKLTTGEGLDLKVLARLEGPVADASAAFDSAADAIDELDPSGYVGVLKARFAELSDQVDDAARSLSSADRALHVLPDMVGADGPRDYLLLFQNNAEIRAAGGMPGSWALIHADDGAIEIRYQGAAGAFPRTDEPVLPLTEAERALFGPEIGTYFQDPGFTPDFPRAAELWNAHWESRVSNLDLDGVLALDPVSMSYLLEGTGPVIVGDTTLTAETVVDQLLNVPYRELEPEAQNAFFAASARAIFEAATGQLASPVAFVSGLDRAAREGRLLVASFDSEDAERLAGTTVEGAMPSDDGTTPYVDIGLNDRTGSKMSYYLRYRAEIEATSCAQNRQKLYATMTLNQSIRPDEAADLPVSVTGGGIYGTEPGNQMVSVEIYAPVGGVIADVRLDGEQLPYNVGIVDMGGRPAVSITVLISHREDLRLTWAMATGEGQTGDIQLGMTPSVVPGDKDAIFESACRPD